MGKTESDSSDGGACYWEHGAPDEQHFPCLDGESTVCARCCAEQCPVETPDWFAECVAKGHPTWPTVKLQSTRSIPMKLVCLESSWEDRVFHTASVKGFLESLAFLQSPPLQVAHRFVESAKHLAHYTRRPNGLLWIDEHSWDTPIYYLAFHGSPGSVHAALEEIGSKTICDNFKDFGSYPNILYFGACSVLRGPKGKRFGQDLLTTSGSRAIIGYTTDVDWMDSLVVDLMFFHRFYSNPEPWKNLGKIVASIVEDFRPAKAMGYTLLQASQD